MQDFDFLISNLSRMKSLGLITTTTAGLIVLFQVTFTSACKLDLFFDLFLMYFLVGCELYF